MRFSYWSASWLRGHGQCGYGCLSRQYWSMLRMAVMPLRLAKQRPYSKPVTPIVLRGENVQSYMPVSKPYS